jgi:hypothetical protein
VSFLGSAIGTMISTSFTVLVGDHKDTRKAQTVGDG